MARLADVVVERSPLSPRAGAADSALNQPGCDSPLSARAGYTKRPARLKPLGYVRGDDHPLLDEAGEPTDRAEMLSLREWIGISGAAIGPGRGQTTQLGTALLFGLANLRTGHWWDCGIADAARDGFPKLTFVRRLLYLLTRVFSMLMLEPFTYRIHMDLKSTVSFDNSPEAKPPAAPGAGGYAAPTGPMGRQRKPLTGEEARARYGGLVDHPEGIEPTATLEITLKNDASLHKLKITGLSDPENVSHGEFDPKRISLWTGIRDDPFIFPAFFRTNVVSMIFYLPLTAFPPGQDKWLLWATSHAGNRQVDHVGRSLRTQNPRFEILNTVKPRGQVATVREADQNPSLKRDVALRLNFNQVAAYRDWDFVPDVMIYSSRYPVGFPNGRTLFDDVAALLAQHGDTLLFELSHEHPNGGWPRRTTNDKPFMHTTEDKPEQAKWPYLADPFPDRDPPKGPMRTAANEAKIAAIAIGLIVFLAVSHLVFARWYQFKKSRRRYL